MIFEPLHGFLNIPLSRVFTNRDETAQYAPGAVDVIDSPATPPAAILLLGITDEFDATPSPRMGPIIAEGRHGFEHPSGDVCGRIVHHGPMVGKGNPIQESQCIIFIERGPPARFALHA